ncbi:MAG TPA: DUF938 domain-containing protein [Kofleriaceae bacterium]|nr:DUF938 domain-containing protein [Kofleriaceae bacterium]
MKKTRPASERNAEPILSVLADVLPEAGTVLEIASGTGQHAARFARAFPGLVFQPTDVDGDNFESIRAWCAGLDNVLPPFLLDAASASWPAMRACAVIAINMIHVSPPAASEGLFAGAARVLEAGAPLYLYGAYLVEGRETAPSNIAFDRSLRGRNPAWGLRWLHEVVALAEGAGFVHDHTVAMPANNLSVIFRRAPAAA